MENDFKFCDIPLNTTILKTPFEIQTNWHIITGAPSSGKTTVINQLASAGFQIAPEAARLYMEAQLAQGRTVEDLRSDLPGLQVAIKNAHAEVERQLPPEACIFLDRGVPDCLAWHRAFGLDPNSFLRECFRHHYASVFLLEPLSLNLNGLRFREPTLQTFLHEWHIRDYTALGYRIIRVPPLPPEERLAFILEAFSSQG